MTNKEAPQEKNQLFVGKIFDINPHKIHERGEITAIDCLEPKGTVTKISDGVAVVVCNNSKCSYLETRS